MSTWNNAPAAVAAVGSKADSPVSWLFPATCPACLGKGEPGVDLCRACLAELPLAGDSCALCAGETAQGSAPGTVCGRCLADPPAFDRAFAAFPYAPPIDELIRGLKFAGRLHCARPLGALFAARVIHAGERLPDCFLPVPLHPVRLRRRGFNQSLEITRTLSRRLGVPFDAHALKRIRAGVPQTALPAKQRLKNPRGAFALAPNFHKGFQKRLGEPPGFVAVVDDVMTTGATVNEIARVLRRAGVARVEAWVVARTRPGSPRAATPAVT